jgi:hypothetical protein
MLSQSLGLLQKGILMIFDGGIFLVDQSDNLVFLDLCLFFHELNFAVKFLYFSFQFINQLNFIFFDQFHLLFPLLLLLVDLHLAIATHLLEQLLPVLVEGGDFAFELLLEELLLLAEG